MARAIIMAGGQGERFWPLTHPKFPKYRMRFENGESLLARTYRRLRKVYPQGHIYVVTTQEHRMMVQKEIPALRRAQILIEPFRNNTASAIFFSSSAIAARHGENEVVSFFPADHLIKNEDLFKKTLKGAIALAGQKDVLVTVGIKPTFPSTAYGYIEAGSSVPGAPGAFKVKRFVEKPNSVRARTYFKRKNFFWNGGIFTWKAKTLLGTMERFAPRFGRSFDLKKLKQSYRVLPNLSIDYALLEKTDNLVIYSTAMDWCDIGSWEVFLQKSRHDADGNHCEGRVRCHQTSRSLLLNHTPKPLVVRGLSDFIVAQTSHGTLICPRSCSDEAALLARNQ